VQYLAWVDFQAPGFGEFYDELPLWSAPFGLMLLERVAARSHTTILDVGASTGWLSVELAERCGPETTVIAVDPRRQGPWRPHPDGSHDLPGCSQAGGRL